MITSHNLHLKKSESVRESVIPDITISDQGQCRNHECYCCMPNFK